METFFAIAATVFGGIVILAGAVILFFGLKMSYGERRNCTLATYGIVKSKEYDYNDTGSSSSGCYPAGLRMLITIDGKEHNVFNETYDTKYERFREGDMVHVKVNPDNPSEYYINEGASPGVTLIIFGAGMIAAGLFMIRYFRF